MGIRLSALDNSLWNLGIASGTIGDSGNEMLGLIRTYNWLTEVDSEDGGAINSRYAIHDALGSKTTFDGELLVGAAGARKTGLSVSLFSIGGSDQIGRLESGSLRFQNETFEAAGIGDWNDYPQIVGTEFTAEGELMIDGTATWAELMANATSQSTLEVVASITVNAVNFQAPMLLKSAGFGGGHRAPNKERVSLVGRLTSAGMTAPTYTSGAYTLLQYLLYYPAGSAGRPLRIVPGGDRAYAASNVILLSSDIQFGRRQLLKQTFSGQVQGAATVGDATP
ncbi:MAG: hypothetical protein KIS66_13850 [Fimbriimonadaceae bacterium]|nr:hypothetical protein [Fimbriimonadaceae bacterium]